VAAFAHRTAGDGLVNWSIDPHLQIGGLGPAPKPPIRAR
jgi:hypothetical protein